MDIRERIPDLEATAYQNYEFKQIKLSDYRGKWLVLAFYPADFTFVCPTELEQLALLYPQFKDIGAEILSISTDTHFTHMAWHESSPAIGKVDYPMLGDPNHRISKAFGTLNEEAGESFRATFIIDPEGIVRYKSLHDNSIGRNGNEILRMLKAAIYASEHAGEVCPASWEPGQETLVEGPDLVGKI
jgi:peroxiredoxin (alkyl hydroperoxide reductase subunit C)